MTLMGRHFICELWQPWVGGTCWLLTDVFTTERFLSVKARGFYRRGFVHIRLTAHFQLANNTNQQYGTKQFFKQNSSLIKLQSFWLAFVTHQVPILAEVATTMKLASRVFREPTCNFGRKHLLRHETRHFEIFYASTIYTAQSNE